jgi:hypothetical protein
MSDESKVKGSGKNRSDRREERGRCATGRAGDAGLSRSCGGRSRKHGASSRAAFDDGSKKCRKHKKVVFLVPVPTGQHSGGYRRLSSLRMSLHAGRSGRRSRRLPRVPCRDVRGPKQKDALTQCSAMPPRVGSALNIISSRTCRKSTACRCRICRSGPEDFDVEELFDRFVCMGRNKSVTLRTLWCQICSVPPFPRRPTRRESGGAARRAQSNLFDGRVRPNTMLSLTFRLAGPCQDATLDIRSFASS